MIFRDKEYKYDFMVVDEIMDNFYKYIWNQYLSPTIPDFGRKFLEQCTSPEYLKLSLF